MTADPNAYFDRTAERVLTYLAANLPLAVWSVTRFENDRQTHLYLDEDNSYAITRGASTPWPDTFCIHAVAGRTPSVTTDAGAVPEYRRAAELAGVQVTTYAAAVIAEPDGRLFGTLCGFDPQRRLDDDELVQAAALLAFMGQVLTLALEADRDRERIHDALVTSESEAETDALTGLANRRAWDRVVEHEERRFRRLADPTVVAMVDLDRLKEINDSEGHDAGDRYLCAAAAALRDAVRGSDVVARIGGDEFAVLLRSCDVEAARPVVAKIEAALADRGVAASLGWAPVAVPQGLTAAIAEADGAMYAAKAARRG